MSRPLVIMLLPSHPAWLSATPWSVPLCLLLRFLDFQIVVWQGLLLMYLKCQSVLSLLLMFRVKQLRRTWPSHWIA